MPETLTPEQRRLRAQVAAHSLHAQITDPSAHTAPARAAFDSRFEREVDPDGTLPEDVRARLVEQARKKYFKKLAYLSSVARSRKAAGE